MDTRSPPDLDDAQQDRLQSLLPWYVNNTLGSADRAWVDDMVVSSDMARRLLARESVFRSQAVMLSEMPQGDLGLSKLMSRVREQAGHAPAAPQAQPAHTAASRSRGADGIWPTLQGWLSSLTQPRLVAAMAVVLAVQTTFIAWSGLGGPRVDYDAERGAAVLQARTLRVRFREDISERELRQALVGAGARVVGGPNQFGEYWLASDLVSVQEIKDALLASGVTVQMELDTQGPKEWSK